MSKSISNVDAIDKHKNIYIQHIESESTLKSQLKAIRAKLRPARKAIKKYMVENNISEMTVGGHTFTQKLGKSTKINKKVIAQSTLLDNKTKKKILDENTSTTATVVEK